LALNNQAHRLLRKQWGNGIDPFAQELFSLIQSSEEVSSGPVSFNLNADLAVAGQELTFSSGPLTDLGLPPVDYDAIDAIQARPEPDIAKSVDADGNSTTVTTTTRVRRTVLPGKIVSREQDGTYTLDLFPRGFDALSSRYRGCVEAANRDVALTALLGAVLRIDDVRVREYAVNRPDGSELSKRTEVDLLARNHLFSEGNQPRPYPPWGSGAGLADAPAQARVLTLLHQIVREGIDGVQHASNTFAGVTPLLWMPDYRTRTYTTFTLASIGGTSITMGTMTVTFNPVTGLIGMSFSGGTPGGYSTFTNALNWAQSAAVPIWTPAGCRNMSWPLNAWNTAQIYTVSGGGWDILTTEVTGQWQNLGGSPPVYTRLCLVFG
jgi:hypothetical protein